MNKFEFNLLNFVTVILLAIASTSVMRYLGMADMNIHIVNFALGFASYYVIPIIKIVPKETPNDDEV